jgi:hypothetical protein
VLANVQLATLNQPCPDAFCHPVVRYLAILVFMSISMITILAAVW